MKCCFSLRGCLRHSVLNKKLLQSCILCHNIIRTCSFKQGTVMLCLSSSFKSFVCQWSSSMTKRQKKKSMIFEFSESHPRFPAIVLVNNRVCEIVDCTVIRHTLLRCRNHIFQRQIGQMCATSLRTAAFSPWIIGD